MFIAAKYEERIRRSQKRSGFVSFCALTPMARKIYKHFAPDGARYARLWRAISARDARVPLSGNFDARPHHLEWRHSK